MERSFFEDQYSHFVLFADTADIIVYKPVTLKPQQIPPIRDIPIDKHCQDMYLLRYPDIVGHTATSY